ncbi:metalloendopeptidase [Nephila pilipes]|uniref:Metalloendopeptidase n=1 Tax=Nephila pilipes TaxID=299642 RepID=A0A8X6IUG7_NEPPI|nr:metalloendopeptidase [Nephila pilipes]
MLWKLLLTLAAVFSHRSPQDTNSEPEFVPTPTGPQTPEEAEVARSALHGNHYGGDMVFPESWNESDAGIWDTRFRWHGYPGRGVIPFVLDQSVGECANLQC